MTRSRVSLAALSALSTSALLLTGSARRNTAFTDYTGADPVIKKFTLSIGDDDAGPGAAITDGKKPDGSTIDGDGTEQRVQQMQQAENAGGTQQAGALGTDTGQNQTQV